MKVLTVDAMQDELSNDDYRELYQELRGYDAESQSFALSLRKFADSLDSEMSHAVWGKYDAGTMDLSRRMKNELRAAVGLPALPITVDEAMAEVSADAEVLSLEDAHLDQVILTNRRNDLVLRLKRERPKPTRTRRKYVRPAVREEDEQRRDRLGVTWREVIAAGLAALEGGE